MITFCLATCEREDLLFNTLQSFKEYNSYNISKYIIIDDTGGKFNKDKYSNAQRIVGGNLTWIHNDKRQGQIESIDKMYSIVKTPYIFHCEDDWEFFKPFFIHKSMEILNKNLFCIQVWLREFYDTNGHPLIFEDGIWKMQFNYLKVWHGFSFNPGLRRLRDYKFLQKYSHFSKFNSANPKRSEYIIGNVYKNMGYYAAILDEGFVRHSGKNRHVK
ncbi:hypothetical protein [Sphingobacterium multivorum]|uniref:hypothetical protein n=1 Tax=Sphingobacterium multivorum TaxID=28454 RepID=UPI003DA61C73